MGRLFLNRNICPTLKFIEITCCLGSEQQVCLLIYFTYLLTQTSDFISLFFTLMVHPTQYSVENLQLVVFFIHVEELL